MLAANHLGLGEALRDSMTEARLQHCQSHLTQCAMQQAPNTTLRHLVSRQLGQRIWPSFSLPQAEQGLRELVDKCQNTAPQLAHWLEHNIPAGLAVFTLPEEHRRRLRSTTALACSLAQPLRQRSELIRVFYNEAALLLLGTATLVEIDECWATERKPYLNKMQTRAETVGDRAETLSLPPTKQ